MDGWEALFWLEVESGHASREIIRKKLALRLSQTTAYAESLKVRLVFVLLAMPWVQEAARNALVGITENSCWLYGQLEKMPVDQFSYGLDPYRANYNTLYPMGECRWECFA
jgi:hypothetical protein